MQGIVYFPRAKKHKGRPSWKASPYVYLPSSPTKSRGKGNVDVKSVGIVVPPLLTPVATLDSGGDPRQDLVGDSVADLGHTL